MSGLVGAPAYNQEGRGGAVRPSRPIAKSATGSTTNKQPTHTFNQPCIQSSSHPSVHSPTHLFINSLIQTTTHPPSRPHIYSSSHPNNPPLIHPFTHPSVHPSVTAGLCQASESNPSP